MHQVNEVENGPWVMKKIAICGKYIEQKGCNPRHRTEDMKTHSRVIKKKVRTTEIITCIRVSGRRSEGVKRMKSKKL
jgi:hypothetical protein